jgi:hypothetical protein
MDARILIGCSMAALAAGCVTTAARTDPGDRVAAESETDCIRTSLITNWEPIDDRNLIVYAGSRPFHVELVPSCIGLNFATVIAFYDRRTDERICGFGMDRIIVDRTIPQSCGITAVDALTDEQAEQLKARAVVARARR